jgi:ArsR family transcriptional regulator, arsenate/arsenite/antimonite-responsive transcriptional repressor
MGITKTKSYSDDINKTAKILKSLGHPARLEILNLLVQNNNANCTLLVNKMSLAQSTISKHLSDLKSAKIIEGNDKGNSTIYKINKEILLHISTYLPTLLESKFTYFELIENKKSKKDKSSTHLKQHNYVFEHQKIIETKE